METIILRKGWVEILGLGLLRERGDENEREMTERRENVKENLGRKREVGECILSLSLCFSHLSLSVGV